VFWLFQIYGSQGMKDWVGRVPGVLPFFDLWTIKHETLGMPGCPVFCPFSDQWIPKHETLGRIMPACLSLPAWVAWIPKHERPGMPGCPVFWLFQISWIPGHERLGRKGARCFALFQIIGSQGTKDWVGSCRPGSCLSLPAWVAWISWEK